jgi:hypothetical protein
MKIGEEKVFLLREKWESQIVAQPATASVSMGRKMIMRLKVLVTNRITVCEYMILGWGSFF